MTQAQLDSEARALALALAEVASPPGSRLQNPGAATLRELERVLDALSPEVQRVFSRALWALDAAARARTGRGFASLGCEQRARLLESSERLPLGRLGLAGLLMPLRIARTRELLYASGSHARSLPLAGERGPGWQRAQDAQTLSPGEVLEADVVVVGTGAGGAAVAHALATRGHAVLLLEEGTLQTRRDFVDDLLTRQQKLYRPMTLAFGNTVIPVPTGICVGGTTTINSGTCFRLPGEELRRWRLEHGLTEFDEDSLAPHFERVEAMLQVAPTAPELTSASERLVAQAADVLGYPHGPLLRNASGCDGQGECCFGCPTDAKRSTLVSYVPAALAAGAMLVYRARIDSVVHEHGRAVGVVASSRSESGDVRRFEVRASAVVLACGTLATPLLLLRDGLCNGSGAVGKHLTLHPTSHAWARFDQPLEGPRGVPQSHAVELPHQDGVRIEGGFPPRELAATALTQWGPELSELLDDFDKLAFCGFLIRDDASRGRVRMTKAGKARVSYWLGAADLHKLRVGQVALARLFLQAGARAVYPGLFHSAFTRVTSHADVERLEAAPLRARDVALTAFHPLGTCRMGQDPTRYVVSPTHETHDLRNLFICDGSAVPGPIGVNPQVTIMALSSRASAFVERRIESAGQARAPSRAEPSPANSNDAAPEGDCHGLARSPRHLTFAETMVGTCHALDGTPGPRRVVLRVSARGALDDLLSGLLHGGSRFALSGEIEVEGLAPRASCIGSLTLQPSQPERALVYDLAFADAEGSACQLYGTKHVRLDRVVHGMTTLHFEIARAQRPLLLGRLHFRLQHVWPWLRSFRVA